MAFEPQSYLNYDTLPSAIITDGNLLTPLTTIPLWAVTMMSINEAYHLPPIGSSGQRASVDTHEDTISLTGLFVGRERYAFKFALETLAESSKRGTAIEALTGGKVSGLILVTAMTIRTDMQIQSLSFTASAQKREALDVSITLAYMPRPGWLAKALDAASVLVGGLADIGGH